MIEVLAIEPASRVRVRSALGDFAAHWHGEPPPRDARRAVELELAGDLAWGAQAVPIDPQAPMIASTADGGVVLVALVEELDEDDVVILRLGPSIVMLAIVGDPPPLGTTIRLTAPALTLYDTNI